MAVLIAHASIDEHGKIKGGQAGDQTGKEVCIREWYNKPWNVLIRFKDPAMAEKVAQDMEWAAANDNIGYDQNQRNTLLTEARKVNFNLSKIKTKCETDCSGLVSVACMYAGIPENSLTYKGNCATTSTLRTMLKATGKVDIYTTPLYLTRTDKLQRGDILISEGHHVVVVVKTDTVQLKKSVEEVAKEVLQGKWGNGEARKQKITQAGYDYNAVQAEVAKLLHGSQPTDTAAYIWKFLNTRIQNAYGTAGLMGNLKAESNLNPKNLQNSCEKKLGMNDDTYTFSVDVGAYTNFAIDNCGYGLAQWTSSGRKQALYNQRRGRSIGDLDLQLEFLWMELSNSYKSVLVGLKYSESVKEASDIVLTKFERPKDQSDKAKEYRASLGKEFYEKYSR